MADVARRAGVSHQTVSRVLNNHPNVSVATRAGVLAAISDLGYRRNAAARSLVTGRTNVLGVISFDTTLYGPASMLYGIEKAARPDYGIAIASLPAFDHRSLLEAVERFLAQGAEGIMVIAPETSAVTALRGLGHDIPVIAVGVAAAPLASVAIDNKGGAELATRHLLDLGHRAVCHVAGPENWLDARQREAGWRAALRAAGAPEPRVIERGDWSARSGYEIGHRLAGDPDVSAVLCGNDQMALGVLRALAERGRDVPGEVSVVGFDDIPEASYFWPPLTTVRQDFGELGRRAVRLMTDAIAGSEARPPGLPIAADLVVRASTSRAPA